MSIIDSLSKRRTYYNISKDLPCTFDEVEDAVRKVVELTPDAFNMKSTRAVIVEGDKHDELWDGIYDTFEGKVPREKIDSFKAGAGTVLFFIDEEVIEGLQEKFSLYAANFPVWANQASGMAQIGVWSALRELEVGASLQHYNPIIDTFVAKTFDVPSSWKLIAQMPFGGIVSEPDPKPEEDIDKRVVVVK